MLNLIAQDSLSHYNIAELDSLFHKMQAEDRSKDLFPYAQAAERKALEQYGKEDTLYARMLYQLGFSYDYGIGDVDKAMECYEAAAALQKQKLPQSADYANTLFAIGDIYSFNWAQYDKAEKLYKMVQKIRKKALGEHTELYALSLNNLAVLYFRTGKYEASERYFKESIEIKRIVFGEDDLNYANSMNNLGNLYVQMGQYDKAEVLFEKVVPKYEKIFGNKHPKYATCVNNLAILYQKMERYSEAEPLLITAIKIRKEVYGEKNRSYATSLNNLAQLYFEMKRYSEAEPLYAKTIEIFKETIGIKHPAYATALGNWAALYKKMDNYEHAEQLYLEALRIREAAVGKNTHYYAKSLNSLATVYEKMDRYEEAEKFYKEVINIYSEVLGKEHPDYAVALTNLALLYDDEGKHVEAEELFLKTVEINKEVFGAQHSTYCGALNNVARVNLKIQQYDKAWSCINQAMVSIVEQPFQLPITKAWADNIEDHTVDSYGLYEELLTALKYAYFLIGKKEKGEGSLAQQEVLSDLALSFLKKSRTNLNSSKDKQKELELVHEWALRNLRTLDLEQQHEKAFGLMEQNKSILLREATRASSAQQMGNLPDALIAEEKELQKRHAKLEAGLLEKRPEGEKDSLRTLINELNIEIVSFKKEIEAKYPEYANLKYEHDAPHLKEIQGLLEEKSALLEYFIGDSSIYVLYTDQQKTALKELKISHARLKMQAQQLHYSLSNYVQISKNPTKLYNMYAVTAHWFYKELVAPALEHAEGIEHLIIVPDGELNYLPFETFLKEGASQTKTSYQELKYLINDYRITYNYSVSLWNENIKKVKKKCKGHILAMGADYENVLDSTLLKHRLPVYQKLRKNLNILPAAKKEVTTLQEHFSGHFSLGKEASEAEFKAKAQDYEIIHLAMHGILNHEEPIFSSLAFTETGDSTENNFLHAYEISKMELNAQLVVLSACETGYGKIEQGNGVASLARSFMYAGVPSLIVSLWQVNDQSTSIIMQELYKNLDKGMSKAEALRQAKLYYMKGAAGVAAHPAFWSAFIQLGDHKAIVLDSDQKWWLWGVLGLLLVVFVGIKLKNKER